MLPSSSSRAVVGVNITSSDALRGTHSFASGDQFEGEWENGWMHGLGVYTWKIGDKYIGEVHYGRIHGFGTYTWRTNSKCVWPSSSTCARMTICSRGIPRASLRARADAALFRVLRSVRSPLCLT